MKPRAIIGLGNPGAKYSNTRHNIGHLLIDRLSQKFRVSAKPGRGKFVYGKFRLRGDELYLVKSTTYMNNSGEGIRDFANSFELKPSEILIAYDDFAIDFGTIRIRKSGSDGGHNGMASTIMTLGTDRIPRLRMGIGPIRRDFDVVDFVLDDFNTDESAKLEEFIVRASDAAVTAVTDGLNNAMSIFNRKPSEETTEESKE